MNTLLPYPDFKQTASVLSNEHLSLQIVDVGVLLDILHEVEPSASALQDHPAVNMWRGHEPQLCEYGLELCEEALTRNLTLLGDPLLLLEFHLECATCGDYVLAKPEWFGDTDFHISHQSWLISQDPEHYRQFFNHVPQDLPLVWPMEA